ncbi:MAG: EI24 domain-containing protein [Hydrogenophaga sp.]|nr:EI24 domain-containing protein [Hydrogenophaga sp.]
MSQLFDSFWRAVAYCVHPRVVGLSFLPLVLMVALSFGLGYFYWEAAVQGVNDWLQTYSLVQGFLTWMDGLGLGSLRTVFAPLVVLVLATPAIVVVCLLLVAVMMTPAMVDLVSRRRFPHLEKKQGGSLWLSIFWSLGSTLLALVALVLSMPLWLIPPLVLILPPLIWGWLTYRVFAFDALAVHASGAERKGLLKRHRGALLAMGVISGYLGAAPSLLWASGAMLVALAPLLVPVAIWIYTVVFAFSSLWFAHYCLGALQQLREASDDAPSSDEGNLAVERGVGVLSDGEKPALPHALPPPESH